MVHFFPQNQSWGSVHNPGLNLFPYERTIGDLSRRVNAVKEPLITCANVVARHEICVTYGEFISEHIDYVCNNDSNNTVNKKILMEEKNRMFPKFNITEYNSVNFLSNPKSYSLNYFEKDNLIKFLMDDNDTLFNLYSKFERSLYDNFYDYLTNEHSNFLNEEQEIFYDMIPIQFYYFSLI